MQWASPAAFTEDGPRASAAGAEGDAGTEPQPPNTAFHTQHPGLEEGVGLSLSWVTKDRFMTEVTPGAYQWEK